MNNSTTGTGYTYCLRASLAGQY